MKQGFIAFFLAASLSILLLLPTLSALQTPSKTKLKTMELERTKFMVVNAKLALIAHLKHALPSMVQGLSSQDPKTKEAAQLAVAASLALFESYLEQNIDGGTAINLWCGTVPYSELNSLSRASVEQASPKKCASCLELGNPTCTQYLQPNTIKHSVQIAGTQTSPLIFSGFGLTACSQDKSTCTVSYIPQDYEVFF